MIVTVSCQIVGHLLRSPTCDRQNPGARVHCDSNLHVHIQLTALSASFDWHLAASIH